MFQSPLMSFMLNRDQVLQTRGDLDWEGYLCVSLRAVIHHGRVRGILPGCIVSRKHEIGNAQKQCLHCFLATQCFGLENNLFVLLPFITLIRSWPKRGMLCLTLRRIFVWTDCADLRQPPHHWHHSLAPRPPSHCCAPNPSHFCAPSSCNYWTRRR